MSQHDLRLIHLLERRETQDDVEGAFGDVGEYTGELAVEQHDLGLAGQIVGDGHVGQGGRGHLG